MDAIDLESVPNQIGTGIIRINDQTILKLSGQMDSHKLHVIYDIFKNSTRCFTTETGCVKTVTVQGDGQCYRITADTQHVYAVLLNTTP